jgi:hypothetical protein
MRIEIRSFGGMLRWDNRNKKTPSERGRWEITDLKDKSKTLG